MNRIRRKRFWAAAIAAAIAGASTAQAAELVAHWDFEKVEADGTTIKASSGNYSGQVSGSALLTDATGGRPGGGKGFDVGAANPGWLLIDVEGDENPMTKAAADDSMTVVLWQKNNANINSSSMWAIGPGFDRAFQFHIPWSDGTIYFDTSGGCCAAPAQRLNRNVLSTFPDHDWTAWHHYAFVKDGGYKAVYVDGQLLVDQPDGAAPLPTEYTRLTIGAANNASPPDAVIDDFAIFKGALTAEEIKKLAGGQSPGLPPVDTDKDGMPDDWEKQFGFNPNDATDAAKDADGDGISNLDEYKAGGNPTDLTPPTLVSAVGTGSYDTIQITFSEEVDPASATALANYSISPALNITAATYKKRVVTLTTAKQTPGAVEYTVTVNNVVDLSKKKIADGSKVSFYSYINVKEGVLAFKAWTGISGTPVDNLVNDPKYSGPADIMGPVFSFNSRDILPTDSLDNYGAVIEGYITPAESGSYDFFLRSDDASQLYISTDDKEANLVFQAEETGCCGAFMDVGNPETTGAPIAMTAGRKYFIRAIYKEGGGGDFAQVAWRKSTSDTPAAALLPIPGQFLSSAVDLPAAPEGAFLTRTPAANGKNISAGAPIRIAHRDGKTAWTAANVTLKFDGATVTPTATKTGNVLTLAYDPGLLASESVHQIELGYPDAGGKPVKEAWSFTVQKYSGPSRDKVGSYPAILTGAAKFTADRGGVTGNAGDYGMDLTPAGGSAISYDSTFLKAVNTAAGADEVSVVFSAKLHSVVDASAFALQSPSSGNQRAFHAHVPWSDQSIYFDTVGCCDGTTQRINAPISNFADYTGDATWWTSKWNQFAFTKKGSTKQIWINGKLFHEGDNTAKLPTDINAFLMGADGGGGGLYRAVIDNFAVFSKQLVETDVVSLAGGTLPSGLPAAKGLVGYWDFNDALGGAKATNLKAARGANGKVRITFDGGGVIQSSTSVSSGYADTTLKSGDEVDASGAARYYRAKP